MKTIGIYPGRFQPAHRGHLGVYKRLKQISGDDTYIATSDKTPTPDSPLNFEEKQQIWIRHGVPATKIIRVKNTYAPAEITDMFSADSTAAVYALGSKDAQRFGSRKGKSPETGKETWYKADGKTPQYFQPYKGNEGDMKPFKEHGYVLVIDDIRIDGKPISGTNIRDTLASPKLTEDKKILFFKWAMGWYDPTIYRQTVEVFSKAVNAIPPVDKMPTMASLVKKPKAQPKVSPPARKISKASVRKVVAEILDELTVPQGGSSTPSTPSTDDKGIENREEEEKRAKDTAIKSKAQAERELKTIENDKKWKEKSILNIRKDQLPNKRKEIDQYNRVISGTAPADSLPAVSPAY